MERKQIIDMCAYWQGQEVHAHNALEYAQQQVKYWLGKLTDSYVQVGERPQLMLIEGERQ